MVSKKNKKVDLERKRTTFFQFGLIISCIIVLIILEWSSPTDKTIATYRIDNIEMEMDLQPKNRQKGLKPPIPKSYSKLKRIDDTNEIIDNSEVLSPKIEPNKTSPTTKIKLKKEEETKTYWITPSMPKFPGGKIGLQQYISKHLKYPSAAIEKDIQGKVFVKFLVNFKGKIEKTSTVNSIHPLLDNEALRIVSNLPEWKPGTQNGQPVNVWITIPIVFQL